MTSPFETTPRRSMSPQRRARIFMMRGGICGNPALGEKNWGCGRKVRSGENWSVEHSDALENQGEDTDDNCFVVCSICRPAKDRSDHAQAAKSRAVCTKTVVPSEYLRKSNLSKPKNMKYDWRRRTYVRVDTEERS